MLGELDVLLDGKPLPLPASRKTRALLGYLAVSKRAYQRNRLCEMFWEVPDDPRAALRWSLNKLRPLTNAGGRVRLVADREHVALELQQRELDLDRVSEAVASGVVRAPTEALAMAADAFRGELLEGLDLADCPLYWEWCKGERESIRGLQTQILSALVERTQGDPEACLRHARRRVAVDPYAEEGHVLLVRLLNRMGRTKEALAQYEDCRRVLEQDLRVSPSPAFEHLRREIGASASHGGEPRPAKQPEAATQSGKDLATEQASVGRKTERAKIERLLSEAAAGRCPGVLFIEGEPGIGKTRMLRDLMERVRASGGRGFASRAFEAEMVRPYGVWIDALRAAPQARDAELAALAPELSATPPTTIISQTQVFEAVKRAIASLATEHAPSAVVVDDIQWIDEPSASLLHYAIRALERSAILFALASRKGELEDNPAAHRLLRALQREDRLEVLELGPLDDAEIGALVRSLAPRGDVDRIVAESNGNPLVAIEIASRPLDGSELGSGRLEHLMLERLDRLPGSARDVALWASAFARPFTPELLAKGVGISPGETVSAVAELERRGIIRPVNAQAFEYDFAHDILRRCAYRQLSPPRRRMVHLHIAHALASTAAAQDSWASDTAHHAALGGDASLAARSYLAAGERCLRLFARAEAARVAYRGLEHVPALPDDQRLALHLGLLKLIALSGVELRQQRDLEERLSAVAVEARQTGRDREAAEALWLKSLLLHDRGKFDGAGTAALEVAASASGTKDPAARARALANAGRCLAQVEHDMERACALLDEAFAIARDAAVEVAEIDWGLGIVRHYTGDLDDAMARLRRMLEHAHRNEDHWAECECLSRMAMIELERHRVDRAIERCTELSFVATKMGEGSEGLAAKALEAVAHLIAGDPEAQDRIEEALPPLRIVDAKGVLAYVLTSSALIDLEQGRAPLARRRAEEALGAAEITRRPSLIGLAHAVLAGAALLEGAVAVARHHLEAARSVAEARLGVSAHVRAIISRIEKAFAS